MTEAPSEKSAKNASNGTSKRTAPKINWNDSQMTSLYANVCNAVGSREEVAVFFGISNPAGSTSDGDTPQVEVQLSTRVIMSPFAAKRLATLLNQVVNQYETRFGGLGDNPTRVE